MSSLLKILKFLGIFLGISFGLPFIPLALGSGYWYWVIGLTAAQMTFIVYFSIFSRMKSLKNIVSKYDDDMRDVLGAYENLPFKKYFQTFTCQACGKENIVEIDLENDLKFTCNHCRVDHAIYVNMSTAVITTPVVGSTALEDV